MARIQLFDDQGRGFIGEMFAKNEFEARARYRKARLLAVVAYEVGPHFKGITRKVQWCKIASELRLKRPSIKTILVARRMVRTMYRRRNERAA